VAGGIIYLFYAPRRHARWSDMQSEVSRAHEYSE